MKFISIMVLLVLPAMGVVAEPKLYAQSKPPIVINEDASQQVKHVSEILGADNSILILTEGIGESKVTNLVISNDGQQKILPVDESFEVSRQGFPYQVGSFVFIPVIDSTENFSLYKVEGDTVSNERISVLDESGSVISATFDNDGNLIVLSRVPEGTRLTFFSYIKNNFEKFKEVEISGEMRILSSFTPVLLRNSIVMGGVGFLDNSTGIWTLYVDSKSDARVFERNFVPYEVEHDSVKLISGDSDLYGIIESISDRKLTILNLSNAKNPYRFKIDLQQRFNSYHSIVEVCKNHFLGVEEHKVRNGRALSLNVYSSTRKEKIYDSNEASPVVTKKVFLVRQKDTVYVIRNTIRLTSNKNLLDEIELLSFKYDFDAYCKRLKKK